MCPLLSKSPVPVTASCCPDAVPPTLRIRCSLPASTVFFAALLTTSIAAAPLLALGAFGFEEPPHAAAASGSERRTSTTARRRISISFPEVPIS